MSMQFATIDELDKIEQDIARKRSRTSFFLTDKISDHETIIFCAYEVVQGLFKPNVNFLVLTNYKVIQRSNGLGEEAVRETMLDKITDPDFFTRIGNDGKHYYLQGSTLVKTDDEEKIEYMAREIKKAISQAKVRVRTSTINVNQQMPTAAETTIADQLKKLSELHKDGILTDEEFIKAKQRVINK